MAMSKFQEMVSKDRDDVFLNLDEFAEPHFIEYKEVVAVLDDEILTKSKYAEDVGLAAADLAVYAKVEDLPARRAAGESLNVDGKEYIVVSWRIDFGIATIFLSQNMSG